MKTNNIASYSDVLVTCMRQNPKWILLSEIRSAEAVMAARNSISSGHYILSTIHASNAASIPSRMYSLLETNQDIDQFLKSIYRYIQIGVYIRGYQDKTTRKFVREIAEVVEFYVNDANEAVCNIIYKKNMEGNTIRHNPSKYLIDYLEGQGVVLPNNMIKVEENNGETTNSNMSGMQDGGFSAIGTAMQQPQSTMTSQTPQFQSSSSTFMNHQSTVSGQPVSNPTTSTIESLF